MVAVPRERGVLNASRHHRKNRSSMVLSTSIDGKCSTPRGITGKIAQRISARMGNCFGVLNASRHHRKNRSSPALTSFSSSACSTPRGITGKIAGADHGGEPFFY